MPGTSMHRGCILEGVKPMKHHTAAEIVADILSQQPGARAPTSVFEGIQSAARGINGLGGLPGIGMP